jgi:hypothetical protein
LKAPPSRESAKNVGRSYPPRSNQEPYRQALLDGKPLPKR